MPSSPDDVSCCAECQPHGPSAASAGGEDGQDIARTLVARAIALAIDRNAVAEIELHEGGGSVKRVVFQPE